MSNNTVEYAEPEFKRPIDVIVWASRVYLLSISRGCPVPDYLLATFVEAKLRYFYEALVRLLNRLMASTTVELNIHNVDCPCKPFYEQAIITALRSLQSHNDWGYKVTMAAMLPASSVHLAYNDMSIIASALSDIERFWPLSNMNDRAQRASQSVISYPPLVH